MELNEKLARFAGFTALCDREDGHAYIVMWECPDGDFYRDELPDFTSSLDACFKWLVPKLEEWCVATHDDWVDSTDEEKAMNLDQHFEANVGTFINTKWIVGDAHAETPALALCKAIEQLIDKETG